MNNKLKLANSILIEIDALKECKDISGILILAEIMTKDSLQLAEIIKEEEERKAS